MTDTAIKNRPSHYEQDFYGWTREQASALAERRVIDLDWENLAEEIDTLGRSNKREIRNRLTVLLEHLLKWEYQPEKRKYGWQSSISEARIGIEGVIIDSPSLRTHPEQVIAFAYRHASRRAAQHMRKTVADLPLECPYDIAQILDDEFMPGVDWHPDDLLDD